VKRIIISRTDNLGDVILTLPMAGILKQSFPDCRIFFLGKKYTKPLIDACEHVDEFLDWDEISGIQHPASSISLLKELNVDVIIHVFPRKEIQKLAKTVKIPLRIGTSHRWYSWLYCNKLVHYSRKKSNLHEAQLNLKLLRPLGINTEYSLSEISALYGLIKFNTSPVRQFTSSPINPEVGGQMSEVGSAFNLILHPKSKGSAREWGLDNFSKLIALLPEEKFRIFITGTREERDRMKEFLHQHENRITDMTGKLTLGELIAFIRSCDGIVSASTGPLHIAAALGKRAIGIYAPMRPIFPQRWAPVGINSDYLVLDKKCNACRHSTECVCIRSITPEQVVEKLVNW
jgi:heptosyltransferase III